MNHFKHKWQRGGRTEENGDGHQETKWKQKLLSILATTFNTEVQRATELLPRSRISVMLLEEIVGQMDTITNYLCWIKIRGGGQRQQGA